MPEDWKVEIYGTPLFGGFDNKTRYRGTGGSEEMQLLKIRCFAMFGGAEIKN